MAYKLHIQFHIDKFRYQTQNIKNIIIQINSITNFLRDSMANAEQLFLYILETYVYFK